MNGRTRPFPLFSTTFFCSARNNFSASCSIRIGRSNDGFFSSFFRAERRLLCYPFLL
jgi:hypothetical protein